MASSKKIEIIITQIINPSQFYFIDDGDCSDDFLELDFKLQKYFKQNRSATRSYSPNINEIVAVFHISEQRWFRAQVDDIYKNRDGLSFILWTIDKGKSIVSKADNIRSLPNQFKNVSIHNIYFAGLNNILPAEKEFDFVTAETKMEIMTKWSPKASKIFETLIQQAEHIYFTIIKRVDDQFFGNIEIITNLNTKKNISNILIDASEAVEIEKGFDAKFNNFQLNKQKRWLSANGECKLLNHQNNMSSNIANNLPHIEDVPIVQSPQSVRDFEGEVEFEKSNSEIHEKIQIWQQRNEKSIKEQSSDVPNSTLDEEDDLMSNFDSVSVVNEKKMFERIMKPDKNLEEKFENNGRGIDAHGIPDENMFQLVPRELNNTCGIAGLNTTNEENYDMNKINTSSKNRLLNERKALLKSGAEKFQVSRKDEEKSQISDTSASLKERILAERLSRIRNSSVQSEKKVARNDEEESQISDTSASLKKKILAERLSRIKNSSVQSEKKVARNDEEESQISDTSASLKKKILAERLSRINNSSIQSEKKVARNDEEESQISDTSASLKKKILAERLSRINNSSIQSEKKVARNDEEESQISNTSASLKKKILAERLSRINNSSIQSEKKVARNDEEESQISDTSASLKKKILAERLSRINQLHKNLLDGTSEVSKISTKSVDEVLAEPFSKNKSHEINVSQKETSDITVQINEPANKKNNLEETNFDGSRSDISETSKTIANKILAERLLKIKIARNQPKEETFESQNDENKSEVSNLSTNSIKKLLAERSKKINQAFAEQKTSGSDEISQMSAAKININESSSKIVIEKSGSSFHTTSTPSTSKTLTLNSTNATTNSSNIRQNVIPGGYDIVDLYRKDKKSSNSKTFKSSSGNERHSKASNSSSDNDRNSLNQNRRLNHQSDNENRYNNKNTQNYNLKDRRNITRSSGSSRDNYQQEQKKNITSNLYSQNHINNSGNLNRNEIRLEEINEVCISDASQYSKDLVLVHGNHTPVPIYKLEKVNFSETVHNGLKRFRSGLSIYRTQQYSWQHILYGNSLLLINSPRSGKTFSYLPAICSLIEYDIEDGEVPIEQGPICIILTSLRSDALKIKENCKPLICPGTNYSDHLVTYTSADNEAELTNALENLLAGRDILICTPKCLNKLFEQDDDQNYAYVNWFSKNRLKRIIIENYDLWNQENRDILSKHLTKLQLKKESGVQIVVTSNIWESGLVNFFKLKSFNNPLLCIGAHLESAIYGGAKMLVKFVSKSHKINEVVSFVEKYGNQSLVIVCNDDNETNEVANELKKCYLCTAITNESTNEQIGMLSKKWANDDSEQQEILICSDEQLYDLRIRNAKNLIHYSLTDMWTSFALRYSIFVKSYKDKLRESSASRTENDNVPRTLILLDENNNSQLPKLVKFLGRNGYSIDPVIKKLAEKIENEKHSKLENICTKFIEFGNYHNKDDCYEGRHTLTKRDESYSEIPNCGTIKYQIIQIFNPVHYSIRIWGVKYPETKDYVQFNKSFLYVGFSMKFSQHFSDTKNHVFYCTPKLNDRCTVQEGSHYYRAQILKIIQPKTNAIVKRTKVKCRLLDVGRIEIYPADELIALPPEFEEFPPQAIDLRLTGIVPHDEEDEWDGKLKITIKNWLDQKDAGNIFFLSPIDFTLSNTLFVPEIILTKIENDIPIFLIYIKKNLIKNQLVLQNSAIVDELKKKANKLGILDRKRITEENISTSNFKNITSSQSCNHKNGSKSTENLLKKNDNENVNEIRSDKIITKLSEKSKIPFQRATPMRKLKKVENDLLTYRENWIKLSENSFTEVVCSSYYTPNEFYVVIDDPHSRQMRLKLDDKINALVEKKLDNDLVPEIGVNCIAKYKKYLERCKIIEVCNDLHELKVKVYLGDVGATVKRPISELFTSNQDIVEFLPFQAVRCELVGGIWNDTYSDNIYDEIIEQYDHLFARPVKNFGINEEDILKYSTYGIILFGSNDKNTITINKKIIDSGYGVKDKDNENFMDISFSPEVQDFEAENWDNVETEKTFEYKSSAQEQNSNDFSEKVFDVNFEPEEILEFLGLPSTTKFLPADDSKKTDLEEISFIEEKGVQNSRLTKKEKENFEDRNLIESQYMNVPNNNTSHLVKPNYKHDSIENEFLENLDEMPKLKTSSKSPSVIWHQSEDKIQLVIAAPDVKDYYLNVTSTHLYFMAYIHDEKRELDLAFFGYIVPKLTSHRLRGLNITISFIKEVRGKRFMWPRLYEMNEKNFFIKYNPDAIDDKEVESQSKIQNDQRILKSVDHVPYIDEDSSDSSDSSGNFNIAMGKINDISEQLYHDDV